MSRQVLTYPDIPPVMTLEQADARYLTAATAAATYLTPAAGDLRYSPIGALTQATADARYLQQSVAATTYLPLTGGGLSGPLTITPPGSIALHALGNVSNSNTPPTLWRTDLRAYQTDTTALWTQLGTGLLVLSANTIISQAAPANYQAVIAGTASQLRMHPVGGIALQFQTAATAAAGGTQTFVDRLAMDMNGSINLTPAAGSPALQINGTNQPKITVAASAPSSPMTGDVWMW